MGYMGLERISDSDCAADLFGKMSGAMVKVLKNGLKEENDEHNTDGVINVALIFVECIINSKCRMYQHEDALVDIANEAVQKLDKHIKDVKETPPEEFHISAGQGKIAKNYHLKHYKRLRDKLSKWVAEC